ncbi:MAG: TldD/PmbA family protein [Promethearchaeati archaeon SRVP18_Atabeyarchaeia-1]
MANIKARTGPGEQSKLNSYLGLAPTASKAVARAEKTGATQAEAFALRRVISACFIERLQVTFAQRKVQSGLGIRVAMGKKLGFSCTSNLSEKPMNETIEKALRTARAREEDPRFKAFPAKGTYQKVRGISDKQVRNAQIEELIDKGRTLAEAMRNYDKRVESGSGTITYITYNRAIANSAGVDLEETETLVDARVSSMAKGDGDVSGVDYLQLARNSSDVDVEQLGKTVSKLCVDQLARKPIETRSMDLVLHSYAVGDLFAHTIHPAFMGDNLQRNKTPFAGKLGKKILSDLISIEDNGVIEKGFASQSFDDEGNPRKNTRLIEKGVINSFLYDSLWANQANTKSTGNSTRKDVTGLRTYSSEPIIETSNIVVRPGTKDLEKLISEVEDGVLAYTVIGAHTSNQVSGAFSIGVQTAFKIEGGEIKYPVKEAMIGSDIVQLLRNVNEVGNDVRTYEDELRHRVTITPSIRFSNVKISA